VYLEEAAAADKVMFQVVVAPLLTRLNTVFIGITTTLGGENWFTELMDLKDDRGNYVFNRIISTPLCERCKKNDRDYCRHLGPAARPAWKVGDAERMTTIRKMFGDDKERFRQENLGVYSMTENHALNPESVKRFFEVPVSLDQCGSPKFIVVSFDPNAGGGSYAALSAVFYSQPFFVLVGADADHQPHGYPLDARVGFIVRFFELLREHPLFDAATTRIIFSVERNTGQEVGTLYDLLGRQRGKGRLGQIYFYRDDDREPGIITTHKKKTGYLGVMRHEIDQGTFRLAEPFVCGSSAKKIQDRLRDEMKRARIFMLGSVGTAADTRERYTWSGKCTPDGRKSDTYQDDILMSSMMALFITHNAIHRIGPIPKQITGIDPYRDEFVLEDAGIVEAKRRRKK